MFLKAYLSKLQKQKNLYQVLKIFLLTKKHWLLLLILDENVAFSARNIPGVTVVAADGINVLDVVAHDKLS